MFLEGFQRKVACSSALHGTTASIDIGYTLNKSQCTAKQCTAKNEVTDFLLQALENKSSVYDLNAQRVL